MGLYLLTQYFENRFINNNNNKSTWIINRSGDTVDYAFLGSSKIYNLIDIKTLIEGTDIKAINLGTSGSSYGENLLILEKYLQHNVVKNLVLGVDYFMLIDPNIFFRYPFHDYLFTPFIGKDSIIRKNIFLNSKKLNYYKWLYLPFTRYLDFNSQYFNSEYFSNYRFKPQFDEYGTELYPDSLILYVKYTKVEKFEVNEKVLSYLNSIITLCENKKVNIILLSIPHYHQVYSHDNQKAIDFIYDFSKEKNIRYINFRGHWLELAKPYYLDDYHLKEKGAKIFSRILKDSLFAK